MSFIAEIDRQKSRIKRLEEEEHRQGQRLQEIEPLRERMANAIERMQSLFAEVWQPYPPPAAPASTPSPTPEPEQLQLIPLDAELRKVWKERYQQMVGEEIPALTEATQEARGHAAEFAKQDAELPSHFAEARQLEFPLPVMLVRSVPPSFWRRLIRFLTGWRPAPSHDSAKAMRSRPVRVVTLTELLAKPLPPLSVQKEQVGATRIKLEQGWQEMEQQLEGIMKTLNQLGGHQPPSAP